MSIFFSSTHTGIISQADTLSFLLNPSGILTEGAIQWDPDHGTLAIGMPGGNVTLQIGQEMYVPRTKAGEALTDGDAVYISSSTGDNVIVSKADASDYAKSWVAGVATESAATNDDVHITSNGAVHDLDTSGFSAGDALWLSASTPGGLTSTRPTSPDIQVFIGFCVRSHANAGAIIIRPTIVPRLSGLSDVIVTNPQNGDILTYNSTSGVWENSAP